MSSVEEQSSRRCHCKSMVSNSLLFFSSPFFPILQDHHFKPFLLSLYLPPFSAPPPHFWNLPHHLVLKDVRAKPLGENFKPSATQMTHMPMSMPIPSSACDMDASFPPQEPRCTNDLGQLLLHHCIFTSPSPLILPHYPNQHLNEMQVSPAFKKKSLNHM